jgi:hypothetical protein
MTFASPPSMTETQELVVPKSIPIILLISVPPYDLSYRGYPAHEYLFFLFHRARKAKSYPFLEK